MRSLFLSPHPDDAVLFGTFTLLADRPDVITVLWPDGQERHGITAPQRHEEDAEAMEVLGLGGYHDQWPFSESDPDWVEIQDRLYALEPLDRDSPTAVRYDRVFAPAVEEGGHDHHNKIAEIALRVFGTTRVRHYLTYTRDRGKSTSGLEIFPSTPGAILRKLEALACYRSQIVTPAAGCAAHFMRDLTEWQIP